MRIDDELAVECLALRLPLGSAVLLEEKRVRVCEGLGFEGLSLVGGERLQVIRDAFLLGLVAGLLLRLGPLLRLFDLLPPRVIGGCSLRTVGG